MDDRGSETSAAAQAREAMERAKAGARQRRSSGFHKGASGKPPGERPRPGVDPVPYGPGREPFPVGREIPAFVDRMGWTEQLEVASISARWEEIVGREVSENCDVVSFEEGLLLLQARSTPWAEQLSVISGRIRQRVNEEIGRPLVVKIRVLKPTTRSWVKGPRNVKGRGPRDTYG